MSQIIQNHYEIHAKSSNHASSSEIPLLMLLSVTPVVAANIIPTLLPRELKMPSVSEIDMIELTTQVQVAEEKYLNINSQLTQEKQLSLTNLLKKHKQALS